MTPEPSELGNSNGNGETIRRKKTNRHAREDVNGRRKRIEVEPICPCADANSSEGNVSVMSVKASSQVDPKKANSRREMTMKDLCNNSDDMEDDEDDSDWDPLSEHGEVKTDPFTDANSSEGNKSVTPTKGIPEADVKKASVGRELTMKDLCNNPDDLVDDEDGSDWEPLMPHRAVKSNPCADANTSERDISVTSLKESPQADVKKTTVERELTMKDLCNNPDDLEDDEDDNDWEPLLEQLAIKKWFCTNCTMLNLDGMDFCEACNEYKESGIVKHGFFASAILPGDEITHVESEVIERYTKSFSDISATGCSTVVGFDERMLLHSEAEMKSHPHPERPDRVRAIAASLSTAGIFPGKCRPIAAREISPEELQKVHSMKNIEAVELTRQMLSSYFTPDTYANEHSAQAARLAAGLCADLASEIFLGRAKNGFALVRPPGHHAGVDQSMGFCLHNNAAIAALAAQAAGAKKVLILDWDVHHGNGTQEIFEKNKSVLYISLHRHEGGNFYPGTGAAQEVGTMGAEGYCVNVPWSRGGVGDNDYIFAFQHAVLPIALDFAPDFVIISAGFDAARGDPLGGCDVTPAGYACMTHMLSSLAGGKLLVILEGGYNLRSISSSATEVIKVLLGESPDDQFDGVTPSPAGMRTLLDVLKIQTNFWPCLSSNFTKLQASWESYLSGKNTEGKANKRRRVFAPPIWWKWGRKRFLYHLYCRRLRMKA